jgi:anti-sigma regulatory factor (Ser/Thr protein kinase)
MVVMDVRPGSMEEPRLDLFVRARPNELAAVRRAVSTLPIAEPDRDVVRLLVNELVTNSIRHAGIGPDGTIRIQAGIDSGTLRVNVIDGGPSSLPVPGGIRPSPGASSGWGLFFVETLATRWGRGPGRFWFEVELSDTRS